MGFPEPTACVLSSLRPRSYVETAGTECRSTFCSILLTFRSLVLLVKPFNTSNDAQSPGTSPASGHHWIWFARLIREKACVMLETVLLIYKTVHSGPARSKPLVNAQLLPYISPTTPASSPFSFSSCQDPERVLCIPCERDAIEDSA
jgi:hypothetical protein